MFDSKHPVVKAVGYIIVGFFVLIIILKICLHFYIFYRN